VTIGVRIAEAGECCYPRASIAVSDIRVGEVVQFTSLSSSMCVLDDIPVIFAPLVLRIGTDWRSQAASFDFRVLASWYALFSHPLPISIC